MKNKLELDPRILEKNLEITKLTQQTDDLISDNVDLKHKIGQHQDEIVRLTLTNEEHKQLNTDLHLRHKEYKTSVREMLENMEKMKDLTREQTPMYMIDTLKECHDVIDDSTESGEGLKKNLRKVISFLQQ